MIRRATASDRLWVVATGVMAYQNLGDYRSILPTWLEQPGVLAWVFETKGVRRGMAMLGFYGEPVATGGLEIVADLLALAVAEEFREVGIGQALLDHVIEVASRISASTNAVWLRLTVERYNLSAQRLYTRAGFTFDPSVTTTYESGLTGLRMRRPI